MAIVGLLVHIFTDPNDCSSNTYGLLESLPHDVMHAFLHGVLMYVLEVITSPLNPSENSDRVK